MSLNAGTRLGPYEIVSPLGAGGMGEVYRAHDTRLGRDVALKVLPESLVASPDRLARFRREATLAASLSHPNICTVYEIGEEEGRVFIAMELVEGASLETLIARGPIALDTALDLAIQIADALKEAHRRQLVHRDLKSANVVVTPEGRVKVLDFGLAKPLEARPAETATQASLTQADVILGTPAYMAPEQALGRTVDVRADLFSFGVVLYELLTGRRPFTGATSSQVIDAVLHHRAPALARYNEEVGEALQGTVTKLLEKDPEERYQSAHEAWLDLTRIRRNPQGPSDIVAPFTLPRSWWIRGAAVVVVAAAASALFFWAGRRSLVAPVEAAGVVVLPAKVYGAPEFSYLSDAVSATLSTHLAQVAGLETKTPPTSLEVEKVQGDLGRIADAYGVGTCVLSSITAQGDRLFLSVQVVDPHTRHVRWSRQYDERREHYMTMVLQAANGVREALRPGSQSLPITEPSSTASEAELALRRGNFHTDLFNASQDPSQFEIASAAYARAFEIDPTLADAAAGMGRLLFVRINGETTPTQAVADARPWAEKAIAVDDRNARAWALLANIEAADPAGDTWKALEYALRSARLGPRCSRCHIVLATTLLLSPLTVAADKATIDLDPVNAISLLNAGVTSQFLNRQIEALALVDQALSIEPNDAWSLVQKTLILAEMGRAADAAATLERVRPAVNDGRVPEAFFDRAQLAVALVQNEREKIETALARVTASVESDETSLDELWTTQYETVPLLLRHGRQQAAVSILSRSLARGAAPSFAWLMLHPQLQSVRADPRLGDLLRQSRADFEQMLAVLDDAQRRGDLPPYLVQPLAELRTALAM